MRNGYVGIYLNGSSSNTLTANSSFGNGVEGIILYSSNNTLTANNSYGNLRYGLHIVNGSGNLATANNIYANSATAANGVGIWFNLTFKFQK